MKFGDLTESQIWLHASILKKNFTVTTENYQFDFDLILHNLKSVQMFQNLAKIKIKTLLGYINLLHKLLFQNVLYKKLFQNQHECTSRKMFKGLQTGTREMDISRKRKG